MILRDLRDLTDAELFVQIGGDWGVQDCLTELARRLSNLRKHLSEALVGWDETCDKLDAAEADRDRLAELLGGVFHCIGDPGEFGDVRVHAYNQLLGPATGCAMCAALAAVRKEKG